MIFESLKSQKLKSAYLTLVISTRADYVSTLIIIVIIIYIGYYYCLYWLLVSTKVVRKVKTFCHTKIFIDNRKETEYASFITHLHLLLHIVTLDTEALLLIPSSYQKAAWLPKVHKFCGIANVR